MDFDFRKFSTDDYPEYRRWFDDAELKTALGGIDEEWLDYILNDESGTELAVFKDGNLLGVIGVKFPEGGNRSYVITNMAIDPAKRNTGLGSEILLALLDTMNLKPEEYWISYVAKSNIDAQRFFEKNAWKKSSYDEGEMVRYKFK